MKRRYNCGLGYPRNWSEITLKFKEKIMKYIYQLVAGSLLLLPLTLSGNCGNNCEQGVGGCGSCEDASGVNLFDPYTGNVHRTVKDLELFSGVGQTRLQWVRYGNSRTRRPTRLFGDAH